MIMSKIITMNDENALIVMKARGSKWTIEIFDNQKCLEQHQVKSIEDAVKRAFTYMFEPIALMRQTVRYDVVAVHDKDCEYVFDFKLHNAVCYDVVAVHDKDCKYVFDFKLHNVTVHLK